MSRIISVAITQMRESLTRHRPHLAGRRTQSGPRASTRFRSWPSRWATLALLALSLLAVPRGAAAEWTARAEPSGAGPSVRCVLQSERQALSDGYQTTWVQIVVDDKAVRVTSGSVLDPGDRDIGLVVDAGAFAVADAVIGGRTAEFTSRYATLVDEFKRGLHVRVQLRFWPTWPKTGTRSATFSLVGFTRAHARLAQGGGAWVCD